MKAKIKKSTVYLDEAARADLAFVLQQSRTPTSQNAVIRGLADRYAKLLRMQVAAEEKNRTLLLQVVDQDGRVVRMERLDLKL